MTWAPNSDPGLAGYRVYRAARPSSDFAVIHEGTVLSTVYADNTLKADGTYSYAITALNVKGVESPRSETLDVTVTLSFPSGELPQADAGADRVVTAGKLTTLTGTGTDPNGGSLDFSWQQVDGPLVTLVEAKQASVSFLPPQVPADTVLTLRLTVVNEQGQTASDDVAVTVEKNDPPAISVEQNQRVDPGEEVTLTVEGADPEDDTLACRWTQLSGPSVQLSDPDKCSVTFRAPYESILTFKLAVDDGSNVVEEMVRINVENYLVLPASLTGRHPLFEDTFLGLAVLNPNSNYPNSAWILGLDAKGKPTAVTQDLSLPAGAQRSVLTDQIVGSARDVNSFLVRGQHGPIQGFFMAGDWSLSRLDGVGGRAQESRVLYFPLARRGSSETTRLFLFNPGTKDDPEVELTLFETSGAAKATAVVPIPASGMVSPTLEEIFGDGSFIDDGFVKVRAQVDLAGFQLQARAQDLSAVLAQTPKRGRSFLVPHFFADSRGGDTVLRLLNAGTSSVQVKLEAFDDQPVQVATSELIIGPNQLFVGSVKEVLKLGFSESQNLQVTSGFLKLLVQAESGVPAIIGVVSFSGSQGNFRSILPVWAGGRRETLFSHLAQSIAPDISTGLAILNGSNQPAQVWVRAFNAEGTQTGKVDLVLEPGQRVVDLLKGPKFFGNDFTQVGGHLRVSSNVPIVAFALFFDNNLRFLSAIEGQSSLQ